MREEVRRNIFDTIACYFVSIYYTSLFEAAQEDMRNRRMARERLREAYLFRVDRYMNSFTKGQTNPEYAKIMESLYSYYTQHMGTVGTYSDWTNLVVAELMPIEHFRRLAAVDQRKDVLLYGFIRDSILKFSAQVQEGGALSRIIDARTKENSNAFREKMLAILFEEREKILSKFISDGASKEKVTPEYCRGLQKKINELIRANAETVEKYNRLYAFTEKLKDLYRQQQEQILAFRNDIISKQRTIDELQRSAHIPPKITTVEDDLEPAEVAEPDIAAAPPDPIDQEFDRAEEDMFTAA